MYTPPIDPDAPFANRDYVDRNLWDKIRRHPSLDFIDQCVAMGRYLRDQPTPAHLAVILFALGYFVWPFDLLPDPVYIDDGVVIAAAVASLGSVLDRYMPKKRLT